MRGVVGDPASGMRHSLVIKIEGHAGEPLGQWFWRALPVCPEVHITGRVLGELMRCSAANNHK
jgi:hypothetical protein